MTESDVKKIMKDAVKRAKKNREDYKALGEDFDREFPEHEGPLLGPRNDIEKAKRIREIKDNDNHE